MHFFNFRGIFFDVNCRPGHGEKLVSWMLSLDGVEAQLYAPDWDGELPLDRARQKGPGAGREGVKFEIVSILQVA